ncbi:probable cytochrome P450 305a1 [Leguminivora glycinivorella]|uniref:probable cytochrome P450 305a1 n=1 Tax=Leguminivora glycinivorella TaxID=1035111 RepID=UPI00200CB718|nr:probable cytochrome P450 305a1 [Leguminivora glycinivorella]
MITALLFAILVTFLTGYILQTITKPKKYPPGPKWLPFVGCGNLVQKMSKLHGSQWKALSQIAKEYSTQVLGLKLGSELVIVVYGDRNIRQVLMEPEFEGRPNSFFIKLRCFGKRMGITSADGPLWREHRKFAVKHLKNVGFGKASMEQEIQHEMARLVEYIRSNSYKPISPKSILATAVMNVLWKYVAGESIEEDRLKLLLDLLSARSKAFSMAGGWLNQFPWCRFFFPEASGYSLINRINLQISAIIEEAIQKHKNNAASGDDFIYSFLNQMKLKKGTFTELQLKIVCLDMFIAGSQTTSNLLEFMFLTVLRKQHIQDKIYDEIQRFIGNNVPSWSDSHRLVYTSAFLLEVQRCYAIVPLMGPRRVLSDSIVDGYMIPKDTTVLISVGDLYLDPDIFENPHEFKPERFIDEHGALKNAEHVYTFGLGRRRCPGDALARSFIFLTFVGILQKFKIQCVNGVCPSDEPVIGLIAAPRPYTAMFVPRQ